MVLCKKCLQKFPDRRSFSVHVSRSEKKNFSSVVEMEKFILESIFGSDVLQDLVSKYINEEVCCNDLRSIGMDITKYLKLLGIKRSSSDERKTSRFKDKYHSSILEKYGVYYLSQAQSVKDKVKDSMAKRYGTYDEFSKIARDRLIESLIPYYSDPNRVRITCQKSQKTIINRYGVDNCSKIPAVRMVNSKKAKERIGRLSTDEKRKMTSRARECVNHRGGFESGLERTIQHCLVDMGVEFKKHVHISDYSFDLLISNNILIEIQGEFWHANPEKYLPTDIIMGKMAKDIWDKDAAKKIAAEKAGYRVVYIWENEIRSADTNKLKEIISSRILEILYE